MYWWDAYNSIISCGHIDKYKTWTFASIPPIFMKEPRDICENYGDVSLYNSGYKVYATINIGSEYVLD